MTTLLITILVFGILVTIHEWGHFIVAKRQGIQVDVFSIGFGPMIFKYEWHNTVYAVSLVPLGGYVKMAGDDPGENKDHRDEGEFFAKTPWQRMKVVMAGPLMNYFLAYVLFAVIFMVGSPVPTTQVGTVMKDYPAQKAGLLVGDRIVAVNGHEVKYWEQLTGHIQTEHGKALKLSVVRNGEAIDLAVLPDTESERPVIGIKPSQETETIKYSVGTSLVMAWQKLWAISTMTYQSLWKMVTGQMSLKQSMTGPIGIMFITGETAKQGVIPVLHLMGLLSAALALFNFLPIPVLDGGHFVFYLFEWIRKKPLNFKMQEIFQQVGMIFLLGLMVFVFYNDFINFKVVSKVKKIWPGSNTEQVTKGSADDSQ